jgi:Protein of unknown function (DUF3185)
MNRSLAFALLTIGILLLIMGINEWNSIGSRFTRLISGAPSKKVLSMLIGGAVATVVGLAGLSRRPK